MAAFAVDFTLHISLVPGAHKKRRG